MKKATLKTGDRLVFGDGSRIVEVIDVSPAGKVKVEVIAPDHVKVQGKGKQTHTPADQPVTTQ